MTQLLKYLFTLSTVMAISMATSSYAQVQFPEITVDDLNGRTQVFPRDFPANPTIVLIAYRQSQQAELAAWMEALGLQEAGGPAWVEFPVIGRGGGLMRTVIDNGMRSGIKSNASRAKVFTVYSSRGRFNQQLGISGSRQKIVALVSQNGAVHTLIEGKVSPEKVQKLRNAYP